MIITDIIEFKINPGGKKTAYKIYIDYSFAFLLYKQDITLYGLSPGLEITPETYDIIIEDTVYRRARQKALALLKHMDRTERELYIKLSQAFYTDSIIDRTIEYLKAYRYIDDERYAGNYIFAKKNTTSLLSIREKLIQKGIKKKLLEKIIAMEYDLTDKEDDPEITAIRRLVLKKYKDMTDLSYDEKQRLMAYLYRKGFDFDKIRAVLSDSDLSSE